MTKKELEKEIKILRKVAEDWKESCYKEWKENVELKALIKSEHEIEARKNNRLISKLTKAKKLLAKWVELYKPKLEGFPKPPIQVDTEKFLKEE